MAVAIGLMDKLEQIRGLVIELYIHMCQIQNEDVGFFIAIEETQTTQEQEINDELELAVEKLETYERKCKELKNMSDRAAACLAASISNGSPLEHPRLDESTVSEVEVEGVPGPFPRCQAVAWGPQRRRM